MADSDEQSTDAGDDATEPPATEEYGDGAVLLDRDPDAGVVTLTLNRPDMRNALTADVAAGLIDALDDLEGGDTRCVVVRGAGGAFCAGGDVNAMMELQSGDWSLDDAVRHVTQNTGRSVQRLAECEFPTVALLDGPAFGAGANLAIACDLQLMSRDAKMAFGFRRVGLAVDSGTSYLLPRIVGDNVAKELVFTGESVEPDRAKELGLVNHVYDAESFDAEAREVIDRIAEGPTAALRTSKRLLREGPESSLEAAVANEAFAQAAMFETDDHTEGVYAFMEKRSPEFSGE
ncbi:enoyl-CoA hydratase/isomerase family protein [Salinirubrum litoreum]|uniref:Enoyl-CoA hydratase/isomerase family protein n=1 Tax=Salinirubrum litoreum TaxID=1126234 RepID=A0ABD5RCE7_9EURY|nr:enoyl-CoA hydratase-related protein [Salinirubrum litoreum]